MTKKSFMSAVKLAVVICFAVFAWQVISISNSPIEVSYVIENDLIGYTIDEAIENSTLIVDAEYVGIHDSGYAEVELVFIPKTAYKGVLPEDEMYVIPHDSEYVEDDYIEGEDYLLILESFDSVYYEHTKHAVNYETVISSSSPEWEECHSLLEFISDSSILSQNIDAREKSYIEYDDISELIDFTNSIFVVHIDRNGGDSIFQPTSVYYCTVTATISGEPDNNGDIMIVLFTNSVSVGEDYMVFLSDSSGNGLYTITAKKAVFSHEDISEISELSSLLDNAVVYVQSERKAISESTEDSDEITAPAEP